MAKDLTKEIVKFQNREVEAIKVIFALAFNLNLSFVLEAQVEQDKKSVYSNQREVPFYRMTIGFKTYFLTIDKDLNIAGSDSNDMSSLNPNSYNPVSNQIKIACFLLNNNLVDDLIKENIEIV